MPCSSEGAAKDKWIALNRERLEVAEMTSTVLKPSDLNGDPLVALKAKLRKAVSPFKVGLMATVNMVPPIGNIYAVKRKVRLAVCCRRRLGGRDRQTDPSSAHTALSGNDHFQVASSRGRLPGDCLCKA